MRSARMIAFGEPLEVSDAPDPSPGPDDVVVRVEACGICRTDWHIWRRDWTWVGVDPSLPLILGHELAGAVLETGANVTRVRAGDSVVIPFHLACGCCEYCLRGSSNQCTRTIYLGGTIDGGFAEFVRVPHADWNCIPLPPAIDTLRGAALGCRFMTAYHAVTWHAQVEPGEWVAVFGCGGVGLSAIQLVQARGGRAIAVDIDEEKLTFARAEGAEHAVDSRQVDAAEAIRELTDGGAHVTIDAFGSGATAVAGLRALRPQGRHIRIGMTTGDEKGEVLLPLDLVVQRELKIIGSNGNPHHRYEGLIALVADRRCDPLRLLKRELSLADISDEFRLMDDFATEGFSMVTRL